MDPAPTTPTRSTWSPMASSTGLKRWKTASSPPT
jgi:hypothetical protein